MENALVIIQHKVVTLKKFFCINCQEENKSDGKSRDTSHPAISGRWSVFKGKLKALSGNQQLSSNTAFSNQQQHSS